MVLPLSTETKFPDMEIGNQGLTKRLLQPGTSWKTPFLGDEVQVHYSGGVENGPSFDSSRDKGTPFKFKLGQFEVIRGWDEGIATMKKGERAVFKIPPNLGYGEVGCQPLVPPNSTLIFDVELLMWNNIRDLCADGGIMKKTITEGEGWTTPKDSDEVLVKYEVRLENGTVVSKSDSGVEFHVSEGYLCPAISIAIKTMRKGEIVELSVRFSYGDGATKSMSEVPHNSNLTIDLELVSWKSVMDVTDDKRVTKKIIKEGEGYDHPNEGSVVKVNYTCKLEDETVIERKGSEDDPFEFLCFEEKFHEGLDRAVVTMRKGERSTVTIFSDYEFNGSDLTVVPPNSMLIYEVELISFTKETPYWKMETLEKLELSERKKDNGNNLFKAGKFWCASKTYEKAAKCVELDHSFTDEEKTQANALQISCNLNNAACKLKLGEYVEAAALCTKVLELEPLNVKALYRRSQSYLKASELEKAEIDLKKALTIDPNNRIVKLEYSKLKEMQKEYAKCQAEVFGTMFSRAAHLEI